MTAGPGIVRVHRGQNASGSGYGVWVYVDDVIVWGRAVHIDGPLSTDATDLVDAIEEKLPSRGLYDGLQEWGADW